LLDDENLAAISSSEASLPSRSKLATELVGQVLVVLLQTREQKYATLAEDDEELLRQNNLPNRTAMAVQVRLGEKKVLRAAMQEANLFSASNKRMRIQGPQQDVTGKNKRGLEETSKPSKKGRFK